MIRLLFLFLYATFSISVACSIESSSSEQRIELIKNKGKATNATKNLINKTISMEEKIDENRIKLNKYDRFPLKGEGKMAENKPLNENYTIQSQCNDSIANNENIIFDFQHLFLGIERAINNAIGPIEKTLIYTSILNFINKYLSMAIVFFIILILLKYLCR